MMTYFMQVDNVGELFGWVQAILQSLGVWTTISYAIQGVILIAVTTAVFRFFRA